MKKPILTIIILCSVFINAYAQKANLKNSWKVRLEYYNYEIEESLYRGERNHNFNFNTTYGVSKYISVGAILGYGLYKEKVRGEDGWYQTSFTSSINYGLNADIQLLPFVIKKGGARIDIYMSYKLGANYKFASEGAILERGNYFEYATFLGASYYFGRHFGLFVEGGFSNTSRMRYGLAYKF